MELKLVANIETPTANQFIFSTLGQIERDLGKLKEVCISRRGC